ncbi:MAG TPA: tetratricopeptide repeat protein [Candidatus Limnocylindrales bacterium]|nr:tetratricopeptide repeat protein [Candidatus Limnocylindrales bacterium]
MSAGRWLLAAAAIAAAAILVNLPTLRFQFVSWDDSRYVTENPWIRGWSASNLRHIFTQSYFVSYMPLQLVSYMLDYSLWGLKPFGYHLQQIVLHAVDSVLAFELVRRLFGRFWLAAIAGLFFALHPSHVESVAWVSARKDVLSAAFLIPAVLFYLIARGERSLRMRPYLASVLFFTLAILSKVNVVVMPLFLVLVDLATLKLPRRDTRWWMQVVGSKVAYGVVGLGISVVNWIVEVKTKAAYGREPARYFVLKGRTAWEYLAHLTGIPRQNPIYDTPLISLDFLSVLVSFAGILILPALVWIGFRRRNRILAFGAGWTFVMLLPAIFFPVPTYLADRYLYLAALGFCWLLAAAVLTLSARAKPRTLGVAVAVLLTAAAATFFAWRTARYNQVWANSESLWSYTIEASRDFRAYNNLARVRIEQNRWDEAETLFKLGSRQANVTSWDGLTAVYYKKARYVEAIQANEKAFRMHALKGEDPMEQAELTYKRGTIYLAQNRIDEGIESLEEALRLNPRHPDARRMLEAALQAKRQQ